METEGRGIPILLVNARMSPESLRGWQKAPGTARRLLACFRCCLAQDEAQAERLRALGAQQVIVTGNLKFAAEPLPVDQAELERLRALLADRPCWLAASTHDPEEALIAEAHDRLASAFPRLLTILVPRHPGRGEEIEAALRASGLRTARRARGDSPASETDIYLADTLGELGLWFRLAPVTFMGGSLIPIGGHNPLEPARLGTAILHGRHMENFRVVAQALDQAGGSRQVDGPHDLAEAVAALLQKPDEAQALAAAAATVAQSEDAVLDQVMAHLRAFLPQALDQTA
jgi:3-deoxy-D-manno-octulosonic-acid transferase